MSVISRSEQEYSMSPMLENDHGLAVRAVSTFNQVVLCPLRLPFSLPSIFLSVYLSEIPPL